MDIKPDVVSIFDKWAKAAGSDEVVWYSFKRGQTVKHTLIDAPIMVVTGWEPSREHGCSICVKCRWFNYDLWLWQEDLFLPEELEMAVN